MAETRNHFPTNIDKWNLAMANKSTEPTPQADKFRDMARELECDEDESAFDEKVRKVATAPKPDTEQDQ